MKAWNGIFCLKRGEKNYYVVKLSVKSPSLSPLSPLLSVVSAKLGNPHQWRRSGTRKDGMKPSLPTKIGGKLVWVPVISFCKVSFPVTHLMPYYAKTCCSRPLIDNLNINF
jgi:hypothetical protein